MALIDDEIVVRKKMGEKIVLPMVDTQRSRSMTRERLEELKASRTARFGVWKEKSSQRSDGKSEVDIVMSWFLKSFYWGTNTKKERIRREGI